MQNFHDYIDAIQITDWSQTNEAVGYQTIPSVMGKMVMRDMPVARDISGNLFMYYKGRYIPHGDIAIRRFYTRILTKLISQDRWNGQFIDNVIKWISSTCPMIWDRPVEYEVNVENGVFHYGDMELMPHSPEYLSTVQLPITHDPTATCPAWDKFLEEVLPDGAHFLKQIIGICMTAHPIERAFVLIGSGSNGKSLFINCLEAAIGRQNVSHVSLHTLTDLKDRFMKAAIVGKLLNTYSDLSPSEISDAAGFKTITSSSDTLTLEYKGKDPFQYKPFAKMMFASNFKIEAADSSEGLKRRIVHIPFTQTFSVDTNRGDEIVDELTTPDELSGLFNDCMTIMHKFDRDIIIPRELQDLIEIYTPLPNNVRRWLAENFIEDDSSAIPCSPFFNLYATQCIGSREGPHKFGMFVKSVFPSATQQTVRIGPDKKPTHCYRGIRCINAILLDSLTNRGGLKPRMAVINAGREAV